MYTYMQFRLYQYITRTCAYHETLPRSTALCSCSPSRLTRRGSRGGSQSSCTPRRSRSGRTARSSGRERVRGGLAATAT
jgi:hypothetical protein